MFIKFSEVDIHNFQSIKDAHVSLDETGIVLVRGINNYEDHATSNGSGKSSIFESIHYALYGKTSNGITNPTNRYLTEACNVKLVFSIDNVEYSIERSPARVYLHKGDEDITCKNKTDTDKLIVELINMQSNVFLSTIFLAQGFDNRISVLPPSGRKERLEILSELSEQLSDFKSRLSNAKSKISYDFSNINDKINVLKGSIDALNSRKDSLESKLSSIDISGMDIDIEDINRQCKEERELYEVIQTKLRNIQGQLLNISNDLSSNLLGMKQCKSEISSKEKELKSIKDSICPTCHSHINQEKTSELQANNQQIIENNTRRLEEYSKRIRELESDRDSCKEHIKDLSDEQSSLKKSIDDKQDILSRAQEYKEISLYESQIESIKKDIDNNTKSYNQLRAEALGIQHNIEILDSCISIVAREFRGYLLQNIIDFMNNKLEYYSSMIFSNSSDIIKLQIDGNKLQIMLGNSLYETLSGGEKRKVDIALVFAQRDLSLNLVGNSSNIIILDEVMDYLDEEATHSVLDMLYDISGSVSSMFIITHNNYDIPFDNMIVVSKTSERYSVVSYSEN